MGLQPAGTIDYPRARLFRADGPNLVYDRGRVTERHFTRQDLDEIVSNYWRLCFGERPLYEPPLGPGHPKADMTDPALGRIRGLWREGDSLYATLADVDPSAKAQMDKGGWLSLSVELYDSPEQAHIPLALRNGAAGMLLKRVGLMGAVLPKAKGLGTPPWVAGEGWDPSDHPARYLCSEGGDQVSKTRDEMLAELVAKGEDAQVIGQLTDEALRELHTQRTATPAVTPATPNPAPATPGSTPAPTVMGDGPIPPLSLDTVRQIARAEARAEVVKVREPERRKVIDEFCTKMITAKKVTPAEVGTREAPGPLRKQLDRAGAVLKFGDGESELEAQMAVIESRPPVRQFGELIQDPHDADDNAALDRQTKEWAERRNKGKA